MPPTPRNHVHVSPAGLMTAHGVAEYLGISPQAFSKIVTSGQGPAATIIGCRRKYLREDVDAWIQSRRGMAA